MSAPTSRDLGYVCFFGADQVVVQVQGSGTFLFTSDAGSHWNTRKYQALNDGVGIPFFLDSQHGWVGDSGYQTQSDFVVRTSDGGDTWQRSEALPLALLGTRFFFLDSRFGFAVGAGTHGRCGDESVESFGRNKERLL